MAFLSSQQCRFPSLPCRPRHRALQAGAGFTLVELLVAVSIVGVLVAVVLGGMSRMQKKALATKSLGNLRAIASSTIAWVGENNGRFPFSSDNTEDGNYRGTAHGKLYWSDLAETYLPEPRPYTDYEGKKYTRSPAFVDPLAPKTGHHKISDYAGSTGVFIEPSMSSATNAPLYRSQVARPGSLVMLVSAGSATRATWYLHAQSYANNYANRVNSPYDYGLGSYLCAFVDGHTEAIRVDDFVKRRKELLLNPQ